MNQLTWDGQAGIFGAICFFLPSGLRGLQASNKNHTYDDDTARLVRRSYFWAGWLHGLALRIELEGELPTL
jgi:hypothetical protein